MANEILEMYTDGSCHTQYGLGSWVAIIFIRNEKIILSGVEKNTTHNRMELLAVINALQHVQHLAKKNYVCKVITDSQYVAGLQAREIKFAAKDFTTKKGTPISNADLVKELLIWANAMPVEFVKIKAHQKSTAVANYNIEADKLSRSLVRQAVSELQQ